MASKHLILCRPLLPTSIFPSITVFSSEQAPLCFFYNIMSCDYNVYTFGDISTWGLYIVLYFGHSQRQYVRVGQCFHNILFKDTEV